MSFVKQPDPMLRDDPTLPSDLRAAFAAYRDVAPSAHAREALFASLEQSLTTAPGVPSRLPRFGLWLVGLSLLGVLVASVSWRAVPHAASVTPHLKAPAATPAATTVVDTRPVLPSVLRSPAPAPRASTLRSPAQEARTSTQTVASSLSSAAPPATTRRGERRRDEARRDEARAQPAPAIDPKAELALLTRAKRALARDASTALALTREHQATFPRGTFAQEREVIAIEALVRMDDKEAALRRAAAFRAAYAHSAHLERIRVVLAEP